VPLIFAATGLQLAAICAATAAHESEAMRANRAAAAISGIAIAGVAVISGLGITHQHAATATHPATTVSSQAHINPAKESGHRTSAHPAAAPSSADPSMVWLESAGGQAQVTLNNEIDTLAAALLTENSAPTVANHLVFETDARIVRAEAQKIQANPALMPTVNRAAYQTMLNDFIVVANLLQPGPGYGTTPQDYTAWYTALQASNITIW
jgi:hypothetical protein